MRKLLLVFLTLMFVQSFSQKYKYGVTANFHKGSIVGIHDYSKGKFGGSIGVFGQVSLVENDIFDSAWLYFMPQIEFSMQGENADADPNNGLQKFSNNYIATQLYIKYFFHKGNMKRDVYAFAGPRFEFLVSDKREGPPVYDEYISQEKSINKFGYGVSFGLGLNVSHQMDLFIRYDRGFSKIYPDYTAYNTYNRLLAIGINYYLNENWW